VLMKVRAPYQIPFYPDVVRAHPPVSRPTRGVLKDFLQVLH
jgi:hypothetical protein